MYFDLFHPRENLFERPMVLIQRLDCANHMYGSSNLEVVRINDSGGMSKRTAGDKIKKRLGNTIFCDDVLESR